MNFRDEYKKSAESISPDREAIDRMKAAVMAKLEAEPEKAADITAAKKPLPLRKIACIGGAAAACACITLAAVVLLPMLNRSGNMVSGNASSLASVAAAEATDEVMETADLSASSEETAAEYDGSNSAEYAGDNNGSYHEANGSAYTTAMPSIGQTAEEEYDECADYDAGVGDNSPALSSPDQSSDKGFATDVIDETPVENEYDDIDDSAEVCEEEGEIIIEEDDCEDVPETANALPEEIVITGDDRVTYNGADYYLDSSVTTADCPPDCLTVTNTADGENYLLYPAENAVYLFGENGEFIGAFIKP